MQTKSGALFENVLWHVILISFRKETPDEVRQKIFDMYQTLPEDCGGKDAGILYFSVNHNLDLRKNVHLVEIAAFRNEDALQKFRFHPKHALLAKELSAIADWQVGDVMLPPVLITEVVPKIGPDLENMYYDPKN